VSGIFEFVPIPSPDILDPSKERAAKTMEAEIIISDMSVESTTSNRDESSDGKGLDDSDSPPKPMPKTISQTVHSKNPSKNASSDKLWFKNLSTSLEPQSPASTSRNSEMSAQATFTCDLIEEKVCKSMLLYTQASQLTF
jgi:hypothetical protein